MLKHFYVTFLSNLGNFQGNGKTLLGNNEEIIEIFGVESVEKTNYNQIFRYFHSTFEIQNQNQDNAGTPWSKGCGKNDSVAGPEVPKTILENRLKAAIFPEEKEEMQKELRQLLDNR